MINQHVFLIFFLIVTSNYTFVFSVNCNINNGYWEKRWKWKNVNINCPVLDPEDIEMRLNSSSNLSDKLGIMMIGDSIDETAFIELSRLSKEQLIFVAIDNSVIQKLTLVSKTREFISMRILNTKSKFISSLGLITALPFENDTSNYCLEFHNRTENFDLVPGVFKFWFNQEIIIKSFFKIFKSRKGKYPDIVTFNVNLWDLLRIRESYMCETGMQQKRAKYLMSELDEVFLYDWINHTVSLLDLIRTIVPKNTTLIFRTTPHVLYNENCHAIHKQVISGYHIQQMNTAGLIAAKRADWDVLDLNEMMTFFCDSSTYRKDTIHPKFEVMGEIFNLYLNVHYYNKLYSRSLQIGSKAAVNLGVWDFFAWKWNVLQSNKIIYQVRFDSKSITVYLCVVFVCVCVCARGYVYVCFHCCV